jgi:uncharacterized protein (TIGR04255 family)
MDITIQEKELPKKISPCPIVEAIVEIRFETPFPENAIFGIIYNEFKEEYPKAIPLPILDLPETIRQQDDALRYKPYYRIPSKDGNFLLQVGSRVLSLSNKTTEYIGWTAFSKELKQLIERVEKLAIMDTCKRVGIRYINAFDFNILEQINLSLHFNNEKFSNISTSLRFNIPVDGFLSTLQIVNNAQIKKDEEFTVGSVIDIDTYIENPKNALYETIKSGHVAEKKLFFSLLKKDFIQEKLNPEY